MIKLDEIKRLQKNRYDLGLCILDSEVLYPLLPYG